MDGCLNHDTAPVMVAVTVNKSLMKLAEKERGVLQRSHPQNAKSKHGGKKRKSPKQDGKCPSCF